MINILIRKGGAKHNRLSHGDLAVIACERHKKAYLIVVTVIYRNKTDILKNNVLPLKVPTY